MNTPTPSADQRTPSSEELLLGLQDQIASLGTQLQDINSKLSFVLLESNKASRARQITFWFSVVFFLLPIIGILLMIPTLMDQLNSVLAS